MIGNPLSGMGSNGNGQVYFNAAAFALPALGTGPNNSIVGAPALGNLGGEPESSAFPILLISMPR